MIRSIWWAVALTAAASGCATTPGGEPHDMSAAQHERAAATQSSAAEAHEGQTNPGASAERGRCSSRGRGGEAADGCWTSITDPTAAHSKAAADHRRQAADHRAASAALGVAESRACVGLSPDDRDTSPFHHVEDIASVAPLTEQTGPSKAPGTRTVGAVVTFRALPGMTAEWLQRVVDCHLARNASLGHVVPEMPDCPLVPRGAEARVTSVANGFAVAIRSSDNDTAREILSRAQRLRGVASN